MIESIIAHLHRHAPAWLLADPLPWLPRIVGFDRHLTNNALCHVAAIPLGFAFQLLPHHLPRLRMAVALTIGLLFSFFCNRFYILHYIFLSTVSLAVMRLGRSHAHTQWVVMAITFSYLCYRSIHDMHSVYFDHMMILVQKMCSLACSLSDGLVPAEQLNPKLRPYATRRFPTLLEFYSYVFFFPTCLNQGPHIFFSEYHAYIHGTAPRAPVRASLRPVAKKVLGTFALLLLTRVHDAMRWTTSRDCTIFSDPIFLHTHGFFSRAWAATAMLLHVRLMYYVQWCAVDACANAAGYGYRGYDNQGNALWDGASNISFIKNEFASSEKECLDQWHHQVSRWLKYVAYHRTGSLFFAKAVLAFWHGLMPHLLLVWLSFAPITEGSRRVRANIRPLFILHPLLHRAYNAMTWIIGFFFYSPYAFGPFLCPTFYTGMMVWHAFGYSGHLLAVLGCLVLPLHSTHPLCRRATLWVARILGVPQEKVQFVDKKSTTAAAGAASAQREHKMRGLGGDKASEHEGESDSPNAGLAADRTGPHAKTE